MCRDIIVKKTERFFVEKDEFFHITKGYGIFKIVFENGKVYNLFVQKDTVFGDVFSILNSSNIPKLFKDLIYFEVLALSEEIVMKRIDIKKLIEKNYLYQAIISSLIRDSFFQIVDTIFTKDLSFLFILLYFKEKGENNIFILKHSIFYMSKSHFSITFHKIKKLKMIRIIENKFYLDVKEIEKYILENIK